MNHVMQMLSFREDIANARRNTSVGMALGLHATQVVSAAGAYLSLDAVLKDHAAAPLVGSLLDRQAELDLLSMIRAGTPFLSLVKHVGRGMLVGRRVRRCPKCVAEDELMYGVAFWRVVHQFLPIHFCSRHNILLEEMCGECGLPFAERSKPACRSLGKCPYCSSPHGAAPTNWSKTQPEAYPHFESLVERSLLGDAEELRPASRLSLIAAANQACSNSTDDLIDLFCKWWGAERTDDLSSWFGQSITRALLTDIFLGRRWVDPTFVVIAVTSFASEWFRQQNTSIQDSLQFLNQSQDIDPNTPFDLDARLLVFAKQAGVPERHARGILSGRAFRKSLKREAEIVSMLRFLESLPDEVGQAIAMRHTRKLVGTESLGGSQFTRTSAQTPCSSVQTALQSWLLAQLPGRAIKLDKSVTPARAEFSSAVETLLLQKPMASMADLRHENTRLLRFLEKHDKGWLRKERDALKQALFSRRLPDRVALYRARFLAAVNDPERAPISVSRRAGHPYVWLLAHDKSWLKEQMTRIKRRRKHVAEEKLQVKRSAVLLSIEGGMHRRVEFSRAHWLLYKWMLQNDKVWFDEQLPRERNYDRSPKAAR